MAKKKDDGVDQLLHDKLVERASLEADKKRIEKALSEIKEVVVPLMIVKGIKFLEDDAIGKFTKTEETKETLSKDKLRENLLKLKLDPITVATVISESTTKSSFSKLIFKAAK